MACSHVTSCELFVQFALNPALDLWKAHYCEGDFGRCARYVASTAGQAIPLTLLPNGKNVRIGLTRTDSGTTALFNAILKGRSRMIRSLVRAGVDINDRNLEGLTPLMVAAEGGNTDVIAALIAEGADLHATGLDGRTAYDIAVRCGHHEAAKRLRIDVHRSEASSA
jgi:hypothetical protein